MRMPLAAVMMTVLLGGCASGDTPAQLVSGGSFGYPDAARAAGTEGRVTVRYDIDAAGVVRNAVVVAAEPAGVFDEAALRNVRSWRFSPRREGGQAVPQRGVVSEVTFSLKGEDRYKGY